MNNFDYDLIVIGAGSGGTRTARIAAGYGAKTAVIEGCLLYTSDAADD